MEHEEPGSNVKARLDRMLAFEGVERQRTAAIWITSAFAVIAPLLVFLAGLPAALYYHVILILFAGIAWLHYLCARRWPNAQWFDYALVPVNFALMSFTLIYPNPLSELSQYAYAPSLSLRFDSFIYFFLLLVTLAFSFSPWLLIWGGLCGALFWSLGRWWVITQPGVEVFGADDIAPAEQSFAAMIEAAQHPRYVDSGIWIQDVVIFLIVSALLALVVQGSRNLLLRRAVEERRGANLARYLPDQLADRMAEADTPFLEDRDVEAAVVFTDIVGFTRWSEAHPPGDVVEMLRDVHRLVTEEVFRADGVLDKFIGDGTMATFGIAKSETAAAARALQCVEAITERAAAYNAERTGRGEAPIFLSVGAHFGVVTVGDVGTEGRLEMAVLGDVVNIASRLEALTRPLEVGAIVSNELMQAAGGPRPGWSQHGTQSLQGREAAVAIWSLARPVRQLQPAQARFAQSAH